MQQRVLKTWQHLRERYRLVSSPDFSTLHSQVLSYVIHGTCIVVFGLFGLLLVSYGVLGNEYVLVRIAVCAPLLIYTLIARWLLLRGFVAAAAWMVLGFYSVLTFGILWFWSINTPIGVLLLGFIIMLSGVTLGARAVIPVSIGVVAMMVFVQYATEKGWSQPDYSSLFLRPSRFADIASYIVFFAAFGMVTWIASIKMEQLLARRMVAEQKLKQQKESVAKQLEERTKALQETQLRETKYLYGFAELGQLSTALLHDLSNHLTVLSLEIEDLEQQKHSQAIARAQTSIRHLDDMVHQVRAQLKDGGYRRSFDAYLKLEEVLSSLQPQAQHMGVQLKIEKMNDDVIHCYGDPVRFRYIMTILLTNAIDAYGKSKRTARRVQVAVRREHEILIITVSDWGVGITKSTQQKVFQPFYSTKEHGLGIGLFIVKEMLATHFHGTITLERPSSPTVFRLQLPVGMQEVVRDDEQR